MPTYEFKCKECELEFSKRTSINQKKDICCPNCGHANLAEKFGANFLSGKSGGGGDYCDISQFKFG